MTPRRQAERGCVTTESVAIALILTLLSPVAFALPVCSSGGDGTVVINGDSTRVNVYFAAPNPANTQTVVPAGATAIPVDTGLGGQASNLHPSVSRSVSAGDILIVVQMIGAEIDTRDNHQSSGNYGDGPGGLNQAGTLDTGNLVAGQYEFVIATGPAAGGQIPIQGSGAGNGLQNSYINSNNNSASLGARRYQVVKVPQFSRLTVSGEIVPDRWNGRWGGIAAVNVRQNLALEGGSLNADGRGFRGGQFFPERSDDDQDAEDGNFGYKGEGIAGIPQRLYSRVLGEENPSTDGEESGPAGYPGVDDLGPGDTDWTRDAGLGAPGTAGSGSGGAEDAGGGGGGHFARGGAGGQGLSGANSGGIGGASFLQHFSATPARVVMGGGGGGSNGNDLDDLDLAISSGQAGGGMIVVRAQGVDARGNSGFSANGDSAERGQSEGGGGGGAGGTLLVHTSGTALDGLDLSVEGGDGGSPRVNQDGGGGGGGGGIVWLSNTSIDGADIDVSGGEGGDASSGGAFDGEAGGDGAFFEVSPATAFDCDFVTLGIAKALTSQSRVGTNVFDFEFTLTVENFGTEAASNVQVVDDLGAAFPNAVSISVQGTPDRGGFSAHGTPYNGTSQPNLLAGTDGMPGNTVRTIRYTVRVDLGNAASDTFSTQARVTTAAVAGGFAQVLDLSDDGLDPDPDGDGDPSESFSNGGNSSENDPTEFTLDLTVDGVACSFSPNPAFPDDEVVASCIGVEPGGSVDIPGMVCEEENGGDLSCTGTASDIGSNPVYTFSDANGNEDSAIGDLIVLPDTDADGIPDFIEAGSDTDGDGLSDDRDTDSDNDGIPDAVEEMSLPALSGLDDDGDGIDNAFDPDLTGGSDADGDGIDDALAPIDSDGDSLPNFRDLDADGDGIPDRFESGADSDGDGIDDYLDTDSDNDAIGDFAEAGNLPPETGLDDDSDGIDNAFDATATGGQDLNGNGFDDALEPVDTDGDGVADFRDPDSDGDGIPDVIEGTADTDSDGIVDRLDLDSDGDGILDASEGPAGTDTDADGIDNNYDADLSSSPDLDGNGVVDDPSGPGLDTDGDGAPDFRDLDSDNDSINDVVEAGQPDSDSDGIADTAAEPIGGADLPDTDGDGTPDFRDVDSNNDGVFDIAGTSAAEFDGNGDGRVDDDTDTDGDGVADVVDGMPNDYGDADDADSDGIADIDEGVLDGTDTDGDGIADYLDLDSDGDGIPDRLEGIEDADGDGTGNWRDTDSDGDGVDDAVEASQVPPLSENDIDNDGLPDEIDVDFTGGVDSDGNGADDALQPVDTDGDGLPDFLDTDADGDGIPDGTGGDGGLETAVRGVGSLDFGALLVLAAITAVVVRRRRLRAPATLLLLCSVAAISVAPPAHAQDVCTDTGPRFKGCIYGGVGAGLSHVDPEGEAGGWSTNDNTDTGFKVFAGFLFHPRWSIELAWLDGGEAGLGNVNPALEELVPDAAISYETPSVMGVLWLNDPDSDWNAFAKLGASAIDNEASDPLIPFETATDVQVAFGVGVQLRFGSRWLARWDYDYYDRDHFFTGLMIGGFLGSADR